MSTSRPPKRSQRTLGQSKVCVLIYVHADVLSFELSQSRFHAVARRATLRATRDQGTIHLTERAASDKNRCSEENRIERPAQGMKERVSGCGERTLVFDSPFGMSRSSIIANNAEHE